MPNWLRQHWVLLAIIAIAAFFRYWQIDVLPGGLFPDEAAYGIDGRSITNGDIQPFFERGNGREGLFMYFLAGAIALFGYAPWVNHLVSASFGLAAVITTYFLAKQIFGKSTALMASFLMAISGYAVTMTRTGFRANTVPLFGALTILFVIKTFTDSTEKLRVRSALFAGLFFGLGFYTYISFRMMLPLLFGFALLFVLAYRNRLGWLWRETWIRLVAFGAAFAAAFSWIGYYWFVQHPGTFVGRAGQVSIFSEELNNGDVIGTFLEVFKATMVGFFVNGDLNWRHNVSGFGFLDPLVSPFFAVTLIVFTLSTFSLLKQIWQKDIKQATVFRVLLAAWFWLMLAPEVTTAEGIPHGLRLIGVIPVIFILGARGIIWTWNKLNNNAYLFRFRRAFAIIFLGTMLLYNFNLYFVTAANSPEYYYSFRSDLTLVSEYLNERNDKDNTYLSLDAFSVQTVDYLTTPTNQPYMLVVPEHSYLQPIDANDEFVFTQSTIFDADKFGRTYPQAIRTEFYNQFDQVIMVIYQLP